MKIAKLLLANVVTGLMSLFWLLFSFGQLQRFPLPGNKALYGHDLVIIFLLGYLFLTNKKIHQQLKNIPGNLKKNILAHRLEFGWLAWLLISFLIGLATGRVGMQGILYLTRLITYLSFIYLVHQNRQLAYSPATGLTLAGLLIGLWGLIQYLFLPDTRFLFLFGWDVHYYRLISTFFDPAFTGMVLVMTFGLLAHPLVLPKLSAQFKQVLQLLLLTAIGATFSRASLIAWLVLLGLLWLIKKIRAQQAVALIAYLIILLWWLPKPGGEGVNLARTSTGEARLINAEQGLNTLEAGQWWWGRGLFNNDFEQAYETPNHAKLPDSLPILLVNSTGLVGAGLTLLVASKWLRRWWLADPVWTSLLIATLVHSLFNNTFLQPFVFLGLWLAKKTNSQN